MNFAKDKGAISIHAIVYAGASIAVGFGVWVVNQISAVKVEASAQVQRVSDITVNVSSLQTSLDALNVKVDNTNHTLDNIAGVLGVKQK